MERFFTSLFAIVITFALAPTAPARDLTFRESGLHTFRVDNALLHSKSDSIHASRGTNVFEVTSRVTLQLDDVSKLNAILAGSSLKLSRKVGNNIYILQAPDAATAATEAHRLANFPGVKTSVPVLRRPLVLHGPYASQPSDGFFAIHGAFGEGFHWFLENRNADGSRAGYDLNVLAAWPYTMGDGVTVAVVDTGIDLAHPELVSRVAGAPHFNFVDSSTNYGPYATTSDAAHATEVSGLIAADINNARMVGVAPHAQLASWVIFGANSGFATDEQLMDMYQYQSNNVAVQNHSWGHSGAAQDMPGLLEQVGVSNAVNFGRNGLGTVMVRSAGNDHATGANADDDGSTSDPRVMAVAAARIDGRVASYSEPGACVLLGAPSGDKGFNGLFTTDLTGTRGVNQINYFPPFQDLNNYVYYSIGFTGTSASAPLVSGITALILSANPNLGYRDVQQILVLSARHIDLADPDLVTNGAGLLVSHNLGFGIPDAGVAVNLARHWTKRPPQMSVTITNSVLTAIPDDGLRVLVNGASVPPIRTLPSTGVHADTPTPALPLVYVGLATNPIALNLTNKGALIERGTNDFSEKIAYAAQAGAAFAIIRNFATNSDPNSAPGGDQLVPMTADFASIPAVFIGNSDGVALENLFATNSSATARISLTSATMVFTVTNTLSCEQVGLRVMTDHPLRGDLRITLVSPSGTRSVLQRYNSDTNAGPVDWTYWSTHHFFESSTGNWTAYFSDEFAGNTGSVQSASLTILGTAIYDTDHDGLDDNWEMAHFGSLAYGAKDDPDHDGYSNIREQVMGTDPLTPAPIAVDFSRWNSALARVSWNSLPGTNYSVLAGTNIGSLPVAQSFSGTFPETEWFVPYTNAMQFFGVRSP
jgi:subtilisin-like proprotein convertase family protein/subtilisin family serine protease